MSFDPWEHFININTWIMRNFPQNEDYNHFQIIRDRQIDYQEQLDFYGDMDYEIELYNDEEDFDDYDDYCEDNYNDSSSESDYDEIDYI